MATKGMETPVENPIFRILLIMAGTVLVIIGFVGIFLPVLPTTPFLLLAAILYARSSKRFYNWLTTNRLFGSYIRNYREKRGITFRAKILTLLLLWATISISAFLLASSIHIRVLLLVVAILVTIHILRIKTIVK